MCEVLADRRNRRVGRRRTDRIYVGIGGDVMSAKEIAAFIELLEKLTEERRLEFYYMIKGAAVVAETKAR